jgi:hypothetical protein
MDRSRTEQGIHEDNFQDVADDILSKLSQHDVSGSPSFDEWVEKYFKTPKMKMMYERKNGGGEYDKAELLRRYKKAMCL